MYHVKNILLAVLAGISIGIGGTVFLCVDNRVIGSFLFTIGLLLITILKFNLFTGKLCYLLQNKVSYIIDLIEMWIGNFIGAALVALALRFTRMDLNVATLVETKLNDSLLSLFILAIFCGFLLYGAVIGYEKTNNIFIIIIPIAIFVVCGFEHCVADMFYFALYGVWNVDTFIRLLVITLGNITGIFVPQVVLKKVGV